jgi:hypothetical protein
MATRSIDIMLSKPGIYAVVTFGGVGLVEVDADGRCHQLTLDDHRRDGELHQGGWVLDSIAGILGPFARAA